jgi:hypothetical protein
MTPIGVVWRLRPPLRTVGMSEQSPQQDGADGTDEAGPLSVSDDQLPEDLQRSEDNPLAEPAGEDVPDDILKDTPGGSSGPSADSADSDPSDRSDESQE